MSLAQDEVCAAADEAEGLFQEHHGRVMRATDRMFAWLMLAQWLSAIVLALSLSPWSWTGTTRTIHVHVLAAIFLGGAICSAPILLAIFRPGRVSTRHTIAVAQMLWSALLIHLTGGRIETHFHVFGSLAFLAFYRDWRVLVTGAAVVIGDHLLRGQFWPVSVYGVASGASLRFLEHGFWVVFMEVFLIVSCVQGVREMRDVNERQAMVQALSRRTERKSFELATTLRRLDEQRTLLSCQSEASVEGVLIVDDQGKAIAWNRRFREIWNLPDEVVEARNAHKMLEAACFNIVDADAFVARTTQLEADANAEATDEVHLKDGRFLERYTAPIRGTDGRHYGRGWYFRDVTARERTREKLSASNAELEERTRALAEANGKLAASVAKLEATENRLILADRLATVGQLSAGVAHEINNPLAYIVANIEFVRGELDRQRDGRSYSPAQTTEIREALGDAIHGTARVQKIVADLKTFARVDEDQRSGIDLRDVLESSSKMAMNEIRHRGRLVVDYGAIPLLVLGDAGRLGQVILNLLVNAAQALTISRPEGNEIRLSTWVEDDRIVIEIADTGEGIADTDRERIFDPFFTKKAAGVGTGLGLSICHSIIASHGGDIRLESTIGEGTRVRVVLPAAPAGAIVSSAPRSSVRLPPVTRRRALVIDDEARIVVALQRILCDAYDIVGVTNGRAALTRIRGGERYDVILCDVMMPEMTGIEVFAELRRMAPAVAERVVFITGGAFTPESRAFLELHAIRCLEKPFDADALARVLDRVCGDASIEESGHAPGLLIA